MGFHARLRSSARDKNSKKGKKSIATRKNHKVGKVTILDPQTDSEYDTGTDIELVSSYRPPEPQPHTLPFKQIVPSVLRPPKYFDKSNDENSPDQYSRNKLQFNTDIQSTYHSDTSSSVRTPGVSSTEDTDTTHQTDHTSKKKKQKKKKKKSKYDEKGRSTKRSSRSRSRSKSKSKKRSSSNDTVSTPESLLGRKGGDLKLGPDMSILSEAFHLDKNTQTMLAYYDARTLEDFCLMTPRDLDDLIASAAKQSRPLPPLQIRKVQVLREWVQSLANQNIKDHQKLKTLFDTKLPEWANKMYDNDKKETDMTPPKKANLIPKNWKERFQDDLPKLKKILKDRGETHHWGSLQNTFVSFRFYLCGV